MYVIGWLLAMILFAACASVGNPEIMQVQPEQLRIMSKAQLIEKYGHPTMKQLVWKDGKETETYIWSYAFVAPGYVESAAFSVSFDEGGAISTLTMQQK